jgi:hypoxanthine-DNA glycosylase
MNPTSLSPIANEHSRILILGTIPSVQSREAGFYYANPRNRFWQVLAQSLEKPLPLTVAEKTGLLVHNGIALWDVLASCEISGSADSSIRDPVNNDIAAFAENKPVRKILCNGAKAYKLCTALNLPLPVLCMPSTSPANAAWNLERLVVIWKRELTT